MQFRDSNSGGIVVLFGMVLIGVGVLCSIDAMLDVLFRAPGRNPLGGIQKWFLVTGSIASLVGMAFREWSIGSRPVVAYADLSRRDRSERAIWVVTGVSIGILWSLDPDFVIARTMWVMSGPADILAPFFERTIVPVLRYLWPIFGLVLFWLVPLFSGWLIGRSPWIPARSAEPDRS